METPIHNQSTLLVGLPPSNELELFGEQLRFEAANDPCIVPTDGLDPKFYHLLGLKFHTCLVLELYEDKFNKLPPPPRWHCSVMVLHDIGGGNDANFGMPEQAILIPSLWNADDKKDARDIMGYVLGPVIVEKKQPVIEIAAMTGVHWYTPADNRYAKGM